MERQGEGEREGGTQRLRLAMGRFLRLFQVSVCSMHSQSDMGLFVFLTDELLSAIQLIDRPGFIL